MRIRISYIKKAKPTGPPTRRFVELNKKFHLKPNQKYEEKA